MKTIILSIGGMSCSACSNGIEKYLNKQNGIFDAKVNLIMANATITYDEKILDIPKIEKYIEKSGYKSLGLFKNFNIEVGGKTGSAEVSETRTDGLFVGFAPFDDPEIGIVTVIENGVVGFHTSEVVLKIMQEYFGMNVTHVKENPQDVQEGEYIL